MVARLFANPRGPVGFQELKNTSFFQAFLVTRDYKMGRSRAKDYWCQFFFRHFSPNPTASGSKKRLDLRREGGNCLLQRLRPSVGRSKRASLMIDCPRLTPKS